MESANIYLTLVIIGITIIAVKKLEFLNLNQEVEHFGNPIALIKKIAMGIVNFFVALLDILLVIADVFAAIPSSIFCYNGYHHDYIYMVMAHFYDKRRCSIYFHNYKNPFTSNF